MRTRSRTTGVADKKQIRVRTGRGKPAVRAWRGLAVLLCVMTGLSLVSLPAYAAVPGNDDFDNATVISSLPFSTESDTSQATQASDDPTDDCVGTNTVWFNFTPSKDSRVELDTSGSDYYAYLSIWTGQRGSLQRVGCAGLGTLRFTATAGLTYHILVSGPGEGGILSLAARLAPPPPANDERSNARKVGRQLPFKSQIDTSEATFATTDPRCGGRRASVWYALRRQKARRLQLDTLKSDYDTSLSVYTKANGSLTSVVCNDNAARSQQSRVRIDVKAGKRYFVMVSARRGGGNLVLRVKDAPRPFHVRLHIARRGHVSNVTGEAIIKGTLRCNRSSDIYLRGSIKQVVGQHVVTSYFSRSLHCHGLVTWRATFGSNRAFRPGAAKVSVRADSSKFDKHDSAGKVVRLKG